jgi:uncharacterized repeat protein (TIGR01451 family)
MTHAHYRIPFFLFTGLLLGAISSVSAQFSSEKIIGQNLNSGIDIKVADLDLDGDLDAVEAQSTQLIAYENIDGKGKVWRTHTIFAWNGTNTIVANVVTGDLNNDGLNDLVVASLVDKKIMQFTNLGGWAFKTPITLATTAPEENFVYLQDQGNDGDIDIVALTNNGMQYWENTGMGVFDSPVKWSNPLSVSIVWAGDINADHYIDFIYVSDLNTQLMYLHLNNGAAGGFTIKNLGATNNAFALAVADFDGDKDLDICFGKNAQHQLVWLENDGLMNFANPKFIHQTAANTFYRNIWPVDLDKDGDTDLLSAFQNTSKCAWFENDGTGKFGTEQIISNTGTRALVPADIDADGSLDLMVAQEGQIKYWYRRAMAGFEAVFIGNSSALKSANCIRVADLDQDGYLDMIAAGSNQLVWYKGNSKAEFYSSTMLDQGTYNINTFSCTDMDGDGDIDIVTSIYALAEGSTVWFENLGNGQFSSRKKIHDNTKNVWSFTIVTDWDQDKKEDLITSVGESGIWWAKNNGNGNFSTPQLLVTASAGQITLATDDLDQDGITDLVMVNSLQEKMIWYKKLGNGKLGTENVFNLTDESPRMAQIRDISGDGLPDLVVSCDASGQVLWYKNTGNGTFSTQQLLAKMIEANHYYMFDLKDIDQDGDPDLICINNTNGNLQVLKNDGMGSYSLFFQSPFKNQPIRTCFLTDVNRDGLLDMLSSKTPHIVWHENITDKPQISGWVYWDKNGNKKADVNEPVIDHIPIRINPGSLSAYANNRSGVFNFYVTPGQYKLTLETGSCWELTTDPTLQDINVLPNISVDSIRLGVRLIEGADAPLLSLATAPTRCNTSIPGWLSLHNEGCSVLKGRLGLLATHLLNYQSSTPLPDQVRGDTLYWNIENLAPAEQWSVQLRLEVADASSVGKTAKVNTWIETIQANGQYVVNGSFNYASTIRCSFDPNDKQNHPNRSISAGLDQNYTLFGELMIYTIRFQNTGNDTAYQVSIRDQLSEYIDLSTFKPLNSSHPFEVTLDEKGLAVFHFRDIALPDSATNPLGSQGFVTFAVRSLKDLKNNTLVDNRASIFFDYNPAIRTNNVRNQLVTSLPGSSTTSLGNPLQNIRIYPNPAADYIDVFQYEGDATPLDLKLYNMLGAEISCQYTQFPLFMRVLLGHLPSGIYRIILRAPNGEYTSRLLEKF